MKSTLLLTLACCLLLVACANRPEAAPGQEPNTTETSSATSVAASTATPVVATSSPIPPTPDPTATATAPPPPPATPTSSPTPTSTPDEEPLAFDSMEDVRPVEETPVATPLDFSLISGEWEGAIGEANEYGGFAKVTLSAGAPPGTEVGNVRYGLTRDMRRTCNGTWIARSAEEPVYIVHEEMRGSCPSGTVRLEYDSQSGTISYEFTPDNGDPSLEAWGTLTRIE